ncbi:MAG: CvpA family protein [Alistipes sp.]|nr:CvpA family protein [Alistipes sp.]
MNVFDIITIIVLIIAIFSGWKNGFTSQLLSLAGIMGGIALAIAFGEEVGTLCKIDPAYAKVLGFIITFVGTVITAMILAKLLSSIFSALGLGSLDTFFGILLSILKYGLILSVAFVAFGNLNKKVEWVDKRHFENSISFKPVSALSDTALEWFNAFTKEAKQ